MAPVPGLGGGRRGPVGRPRPAGAAFRSSRKAPSSTSPRPSGPGAGIAELPSLSWDAAESASRPRGRARRLKRAGLRQKRHGPGRRLPPELCRRVRPLELAACSGTGRGWERLSAVLPGELLQLEAHAAEPVEDGRPRSLVLRLHSALDEEVGVAAASVQKTSPASSASLISEA